MILFMKRIFLFLSIIFLLMACTKEEVSDLQSDHFVKFYGSFLEDRAYDMEDSGDGNLIITGSLERLSTGKDIALIKVDEFGNQAEWSPKYFGSGYDDEGCCVKVLENGYLIAGYTTNDAGDKDAIIIKTDLQGNSTGEEFIYSNSGDEYAVDIELRPDGGFFIVGYSESLVSEEKSFFVVGLDDNLNNARITTSHSRGEEFLKIYNNGEGEYIALGNQYSSNSAEESQFFLVKLNETGNIFDLAFLGSPTIKEVLTDAVAVDESTLYLLGTALEKDSTRSKIILKKVVDLKEQWTRFISASGSLEGKAIVLRDDGSLVLGADKVLDGDKNILVYFLDGEGNVTSSREYGETGDQTVEDRLYSDNQLIILGSNAHQENSMISLIKTDANGNLWE